MAILQKQSKLFGAQRAEAPADETSKNAQLLLRAGFIEKHVAGIFSYLPLGWRVHQKVANIIRDEINGIDGQEIFMPALAPKALWEETDRYDKVDILYKLEGRSGQFVLGPTHEEIVTDLARKHISSYRDLPVGVYQIQTKFRDEPRAKSGLLRGREFSMKDLYTFHTDIDDLREYYDRAIEAYLRIFSRTGLTAFAVEASGGDFSKDYSHEFMVKNSAGEDVTFHCGNCSWAQNKEIADVKEGDSCPSCEKEIMEDKTVEAGNIFKLGTKFSESMGANFTDQDGEQKPLVMGCYGIGLGRLMATVVEVLSDDNGMVWPASLTPFNVHVVGIGEDEKALAVAERLTSAGFDVLYDDRDASAGVKLNDADLIGITYRVVVSKKTGEQVEIKRRDSEEAKLVDIDDALSELERAYIDN